jgi:hypothetical protein
LGNAQSVIRADSAYHLTTQLAAEVPQWFGFVRFSRLFKDSGDLPLADLTSFIGS